MQISDPSALPVFLFAGSSPSTRRDLLALRRAGRIRPIGPRLYTSLPEQQTEQAVRSAWTQIVSELFPAALISHRTAFEFKPSPQHEIFLTANTNRTIEYPGLRLHFLRGPAPLVDDPPFLKLRSSSLPRLLLENLSRPRKSIIESRVTTEDIERRLDEMLQHEGEEKLNQLRDRARQLSDELGWGGPFKRLEGIIGTLLGTRNSASAGVIGRARAAGEPFDPPCLARLQLLFAELRTRSFPTLVDPFSSPEHFRNKAFFEAYFSNYIEGTIFEIEEAERIVFDRKIPESRPKDAHDIVGTFRLVSDLGEMTQTPRDFDHLVKLLQRRHASLMEQRPELLPGTFKDLRNRAGATHFVEPNLVLGTLRKGFELYAELEVGLRRAVFLMFLVLEVHPFHDGNGRIARVMMNAELLSAGVATAIIPTVFRDDYLQSLRALTRRERPALIVETLIRAQQFSALDFTSYPVILRELERRNWFRDPDETRIVM